MELTPLGAACVSMEASPRARPSASVGAAAYARCYTDVQERSAVRAKPDERSPTPDAPLKSRRPRLYLWWRLEHEGLWLLLLMGAPLVFGFLSYFILRFGSP
jgi:hypothetical protein